MENPAIQQRSDTLNAIIASIITSIVFSSAVLWVGISKHIIRVEPSVEGSTEHSTATEHPTVTPLSSIVSEEERIEDTVKRVEPAVVSVIISKDLPIVEQYFDNPLRDDPFGSDFPFNFGIPRYRQNGTERRQVGGGTAFFVSTDGILMTNRHVVSDEEADYTVLLNDGTKLKATVLTRDPANDIALLKVDKQAGKDFPSLSFAVETAKLGQKVIAIGNALGEFRNTVSLGVVSGLSRSITAGSPSGGESERIDRIIQTDAAINQGNSGGPLLNLSGEVIGMNTAVAAGAQNVGFAIPAADLRSALEAYKKNGRIVRPQLGIRYTPITKELKDKNNLPYDYGVIVVRGDQPTDLAVIPGSPADKAGLTENDIILEADGRKLTEDVSLAAIVRSKSPGDSLKLRVFHKGKEIDVSVTLEEGK